MCTYLSVALSSMLVFNHWLVKEPVTQNPFKLVYSVVRYTIKHKHPECRSAFTFCEDERPSRIDFGNSKYGGPVTTEQVEDVKTCLRILIVLLVKMLIFGVIFAIQQLILNLSSMLTDVSSPENKSFPNCYSKKAFSVTIFFMAVILMPLYEIIFYPMFYRCLERIKSGWKFGLGILLLLAKILSVLVIETVARYKYLDSTNFNTSILCLGCGTLSISTDYYISDTLFNEGTHNWHRLLYVCGMCSCGDRHKSTIF